MKKLIYIIRTKLGITRNIKTLLELLLNLTIEECKLGLCGNACELCRINIITEKEKYKLIRFINKNAPVNKYSFYFYWEPGTQCPRIKWLTDQINLLK